MSREKLFMNMGLIVDYVFTTHGTIGSQEC